MAASSEVSNRLHPVFLKEQTDSLCNSELQRRWLAFNWSARTHQITSESASRAVGSLPLQSAAEDVNLDFMYLLNLVELPKFKKYKNILVPRLTMGVKLCTVKFTYCSSPPILSGSERRDSSHRDAGVLHARNTDEPKPHKRSSVPPRGQTAHSCKTAKRVWSRSSNTGYS